MIPDTKELKQFLLKSGAAGVLLAWVINLQLQVTNLQKRCDFKDQQFNDWQTGALRENTKALYEFNLRQQQISKQP